MVALWKYFSKEESSLPDPSGLLARSIPKSSILGANSKVRELLKESNLSTSSTTVTIRLGASMPNLPKSKKPSLENMLQRMV